MLWCAVEWTKMKLKCKHTEKVKSNPSGEKLNFKNFSLNVAIFKLCVFVHEFCDSF